MLRGLEPAAPGAPLQREVEAIGRAVDEGGLISRDELFGMVGARRWGLSRSGHAEQRCATLEVVDVAEQAALAGGRLLTAKRSPMTSDSTRWPLLEERAPFATAAQRERSRRLPRSVWLLMGLAFLCGGLVSAAGFSIGWRHQAQRDTAAQSALAAATARTHRLEQRINALQASLDGAHGAAARAQASVAAAAASEHALARAGAKVGEEATATNRGAASISSGDGSLSAAATRIAGELKTLDTYLNTTPTAQLDPGYIASQTAYLSQQLRRLQGDAGTLGSSVASFDAGLRQLGRDARALKTG